MAARVKIIDRAEAVKLSSLDFISTFNQTWGKVLFKVFKVVSSEFCFHKPITVHIELYLFYLFIHFLLYIGQY